MSVAKIKMKLTNNNVMSFHDTIIEDNDHNTIAFTKTNEDFANNHNLQSIFLEDVNLIDLLLFKSHLDKYHDNDFCVFMSGYTNREYDKYLHIKCDPDFNTEVLDLYFNKTPDSAYSSYEEGYREFTMEFEY
ncbi:MAG: hypothetical protein J0G32_01035 [Alphaproteobacteria bacterium]|nr:hypothetical protein [Alphaproteobacteria bacterium]OJV13202.1 MAG: hypothetical protein BGO27_00155 [Alphaproteobacteria bacterium 33-17]